MKMLMVLSLLVWMFHPVPALAKSTYVYVVTRLSGEKVTYNKDGQVTKYGDYKMKYAHGRLAALTDRYTTYAFTYRKGKLVTVNKQKVTYEKKRMTYLDEKMKTQTSPKGTCVSFLQASPYSDRAQFLFNAKGQLLVSHFMDYDAYYTYDEMGLVVHGSKLDLSTGVGAYQFTMKNTYRKQLLKSRTIAISYDSHYTKHEIFTYKKMRVQDVRAVKKQQTVLLNNLDLIHLVF